MSLWDKVAKLRGTDPARQTRQTAMRTAANALVFGESDEAGVQELHLQRRRGNPLFPPERRQVTIDELAEARVRDMTAAAEFEQEYKKYLAELKSAMGSGTLDWFQDARKRIDELIDRATAIGGRALVRRAELEELFRTLVDEVRPAIAAHRPESLAAFDRANAFRAAGYGRPGFAFAQQTDSLPPEEIVPALLCEPPAVIADAFRFAGADTQAQIRSEAARVLRTAKQEGHQIPNLEQVVEALGLPRIPTP